MIVAYYPHSKNTHIWNFMEFKLKAKFNVWFYNPKSLRVYYNMQMVCNTNDIKKVTVYDKQKKKPKTLT